MGGALIGPFVRFASRIVDDQSWLNFSPTSHRWCNLLGLSTTTTPTATATATATASATSTTGSSTAALPLPVTTIHDRCPLARGQNDLGKGDTKSDLLIPSREDRSKEATVQRGVQSGWANMQNPKCVAHLIEL